MRVTNGKLTNMLGTWLVFCFMILCSPFLLLNYLGLFVFNSLWLWCISIFNVKCDFLRDTTIRSLVDTPRNQGIFSVLLNIQGPAQPEAVRRHLQEVLNRRDKRGNLTFPRLRQFLVKRFGKYAWREMDFELNQNLLIAAPNYRGRPISDINIQDYITDIVLKYLPNGVSPWQMVIIPSTDVQHYILLRVHHAILNGGVNIADLLPIIQPMQYSTPTADSKLPLLNVVKKPKYVPLLKERFLEDFTNLWNEFVSSYDPLEQTEVIKTSPGLFQYFGIMLIAWVSICKECRKGYNAVKQDPISKMRYFNATFVKETNRRQLTFSNFLNALFETIHPINIIKGVINWWYCLLLLLLKVPVLLYQELMTVYSCYKTEYCGYSNTITGFLYGYIPLFYNGTIEICYYLGLLIQAPAIIFEQIVFEPETIQTIPPCGRKVVSWSEPVNVNFIRKIAKSTGVSETEILLATISTTIARYCAQAGVVTPSEIPVTIRNVNSNYIFLSGEYVKPKACVSGLIALRLPVLSSEKDETFLENLRVVKDNFAKAMDSQAISYLLTILQTKYGTLTNFLPATLIQVLLRYLSRKYTISITEITNNYNNTTVRTTWGKDVTNVIYWRPPQSNMSISLCYNQYGENITLGVMCDAQLLPHHSVLTKDFPDHIEDIAISAHLN